MISPGCSPRLEAAILYTAGSGLYLLTVSADNVRSNGRLALSRSADWVATLMFESTANVKRPCSLGNAIAASGQGLRLCQRAKKASTSSWDAAGGVRCAANREVRELRRISSGGVQGRPEFTACTPVAYPSIDPVANVLASMDTLYFVASGPHPAARLPKTSNTVPMMSNARAFTVVVPMLSADLPQLLRAQDLHLPKEKPRLTFRPLTWTRFRTGSSCREDPTSIFG